MTVRQDEYTISIEAFHGPLDLLLYLIRRAEVDLYDIPISEITRQYLDFLKDVRTIDIELAGEFLVMAATLMEIKSRMLSPAPPPGQEGESGSEDAAAVEGLDASDPRYELVCQLLAYKKFREAAEALDARRQNWSMRFPAAGAAQPRAVRDEQEGPAPEQATSLEDVSVWDLYRHFARIIEAVDFGRIGQMALEYDDTPISLHQADLLDQLHRSEQRSLSLRTVLAGRRRGEILGLFLATLELVREWKVTVRQDRLNDDILLVLRDDAPEGAGHGA